MSVRCALGGALAIAAICAAAGCLDSRVTTCGDYLCPAGLICHPSGDGCIHPDRLDCEGQPDFAPCAYPGVPDGACYDGLCEPGGCGNGHVDPDEVCDDGDLVGGDGCSAACDSLESCGNGVVDLEVGETCDDGDFESQDACSSACALERPTWSPADGGAPPSWGVVTHAMAYDAARGETVMVTSSFLGLTTMTWDGTSWATAPADRNPPVRMGAGIAYDGKRRRVVLFGGLENISRSRSDTWEWDGQRWHEVTPEASPPPRYGHAMAYDAARGRVVLFGGKEDLYGSTLGDTWEWDGTTWTQMATSLAPGPRWVSVMAYDPERGRVVLVGGDDGAVGATGDVWEWDGATWTDVTPSVPGPLPRSGAALVFDPASEQLVFFGGSDPDLLAPATGTWTWNGSTFTEIGEAPAGGAYAVADVARRTIISLFFTSDAPPTVWEWDGTAWRDISPPAAAPAPRAGAAVAYDPVRDRLVLFGGESAEANVFGDTWEWDGAAWTNVTPPSGSPPPRKRHAMAYDAIGGRVLLLGGESWTGDDLGGTWAWDGITWTEVAVAASSPSARSEAAMATAADGTIVLHGGRSTDTYQELAETWLWDGASWSAASPTTLPTARAAAGMALVGDGTLVLFGGTGPAGTLADTWRWDGTDWADVSPAFNAPAGRTGHVMASGPDGLVYLTGGCVSDSSLCIADTWRWTGTQWELAYSTTPGPASRFGATGAGTPDGIVVFGGFTDNTVGPGDETWRYELIPDFRWVERSPVTGRPSPRAATAAYDTARGEIVLFGGSDDSTSLGGTFTSRGAGWIRRAPVSAPSPRGGAAMAYDAARERVVLFGGGAADEFFDETWEWDGAEWIERTATGTNPSPRVGAAIAYDEARGVVVLFGGNGLDGSTADTWTWDGTSWTLHEVATAPPERVFAAAAYDPVRERVVLFGGAGSGLLADTWEWDGATWTEIPTTTSPEGRVNHALVYDQALGRVLLYGGQNIAASFGDVHAWDGTAWQTIDPGNATDTRMGMAYAYDAARRATVIFGGAVGPYRQYADDTWTLRWETDAEPDGCRYGIDGDSDGLIGCADPDCAGWCVGAGDGTCNEALETCRLTDDCGACPTVCGDFLCEPGETACPADC